MSSFAAVKARDGVGGHPYRHFDTLPFGLGVLRERRVVYANPALLGLTGYGPEQVLGRAFTELLSPEEVPLITERQLRRLRGEPAPDTYEVTLRTAGGDRRVELSVSVSGADTLMLVRDITARVERRQVLQRMATLGTSLPTIHSEEEVLGRVFEGLAELELSYGYLVPDGERVWLGHAF
ncbi:MAG TPA: PAS domain S-box protein, partial [Myxococcaceae bacterium]|nr:PAS domain S-box protein [Myxococcaceae bacterium]